MFTMEEMEKWNYKTAWEFFSENALHKYIPESELYIRSFKFVPTIDLRTNKNAVSLIGNSITPRTFILIDGGSANGKTTFANRLAKHFGAEVVDIDIICGEYITGLLALARTYQERCNILRQYDQLTDQYIFNNLERVIREKSKLGKPVILIGCYLEVIYRTIIVRTLGKYFESVVSIFCCEESFKQVEKFITQRDGEDKRFYDYEKLICKQQYKAASKLVSRKNINALGIGMSASFVVCSRNSNMFK